MTNKAAVNNLVHIARLVLLVPWDNFSEVGFWNSAIIHFALQQVICVSVTPFPALCVYISEKELISESKDYHDFSLCTIKF